VFGPENNHVTSLDAQTSTTTQKNPVASHTRVPYTISRGGGKVRACHGCRQAKGKCDGDGVSSCRRCARLSLTCNYPDGCAVKSMQAQRGAKRAAPEMLTTPFAAPQDSSSSQTVNAPPGHNTNSDLQRPSKPNVMQDNLLCLSYPRNHDLLNNHGWNNHNQTSWTDILHRPELTSFIQSEGWSEHMRTLLIFALQNDDSLQLGYVLVMARSSGLTLRDLIRSPDEQAHAAQLMFGGNSTTPQLQDAGAHYATMIQELSKSSLENLSGPLPACLTWIWGARDCALLLFFTSGDGNTNFFMNTLFSNTVQSKESLMSALASNRAFLSLLAPSERETMMSIRIRAYAELNAQSPIHGENGSFHKTLRVELEDENVRSLGSSFIEFAVVSAGNVESRYVCLCIRPKHQAVENEAILLGDMSPRLGAEERYSDDELIASILGEDGMASNIEYRAAEKLEI